MKPRALHRSAVRPGIVTLVVILVSLWLGSAAMGAHRRTAGPGSRFPALTVEGLTIEPQPVERLPRPALSDDFARILAEDATSQAERSLLNMQLTGSVVRKAETGAQRLPRLVGAVRIPVSLPPDLHGLKAARQKGDLATATVQLLDAEGRVLATGTAAVEWNDVRWLRGAKYRRSRPVYEVLAEAARKSVDLAIEQVVAHYY